MKRSSSPWTFFILTLLVVAVGIGSMEYLRRAEQAKVDALDLQIEEANTKLQSLKKREAALKVNEERRKDVESRLLDAKGGNLYAQDLMAMVRANRAAVTQMPQVMFSAQEAGAITAMTISTSVSGTEAQVLGFIRMLEEGRPIAQITNISWNITMENGVSGSPGNANLSLSLYGPLKLPDPAQQKPGQVKPPASKSKP